MCVCVCVCVQINLKTPPNSETFTKSVTRFRNAYHNEETKIDRAKPTSKTLADMKLAYNNFVTAYAEQGNADKFFEGKNHIRHLKIF